MAKEAGAVIFDLRSKGERHYEEGSPGRRHWAGVCASGLEEKAEGLEEARALGEGFSEPR